MPSAKRAFSFLSSCFTNSYFEIKLVFTPVKEKSFFYQPKWASLGQSQRSQTSWQYLIKQTSYLIPPVSQRHCRWGRGIILRSQNFVDSLHFHLHVGKFVLKFVHVKNKKTLAWSTSSATDYVCRLRINKSTAWLLFLSSPSPAAPMSDITNWSWHSHWAQTWP